MVTKDERPSASRVVEGDGRQRRLVQFGLDWTGLGDHPGWAGLCCAFLLQCTSLRCLLAACSGAATAAATAAAALGRTQAGWRLEQ